MKRSITQRLVDKNTWKTIYEGFKDAFSAHHKRRPRPEEEKDPEDEKKEIFGLNDGEQQEEQSSVEAPPFDQAEVDLDENLKDKENENEEFDVANGEKKSRPSALRIRPSRSILMHY